MSDKINYRKRKDTPFYQLNEKERLKRLGYRRNAMTLEIVDCRNYSLYKKQPIQAIETVRVNY